MKEELADVMIYSVLFAEALGLDIEEIVMDKLSLNNKISRRKSVW